MAKVLGYDLEVSESEVQSGDNVYFRTNTFMKGMKTLIPKLLIK